MTVHLGPERKEIERFMEQSMKASITITSPPHIEGRDLFFCHDGT